MSRARTAAGAVAALALALWLAPGARAQEHGHEAPHGEAAHGEAAHGEAAHGEAAHGDAHGDSAHGDAHGDHHALSWYDLGGAFVNFGIWLALLAFMLRKPLADFLVARRAAIVEGMADARRQKEAAEAKFQQYSDRIDNLDSELDRIRDDMKRAGMEERDRIVEEASKKAERMRADARFLIDQQMKQLRQDLTREAIEAAIGAAREILEKGTTVADQERLARDYLSGIKTSMAERKQEGRS